MRHSPYPRMPKREATPRRLAAARRVIELQKQKYPMFVDQFEFETPEGRVARQTEAVEKWQVEMRHLRAEEWLEARRLLRELPEELRRSILAEWNHGNLPGSPEYLMDLIRRRR